jgi:hypothetical protein
MRFHLIAFEAQGEKVSPPLRRFKNILYRDAVIKIPAVGKCPIGTIETDKRFLDRKSPRNFQKGAFPLHLGYHRRLDFINTIFDLADNDHFIDALVNKIYLKPFVIFPEQRAGLNDNVPKAH